jgi:hypothetical protein
MSIEIAQFRAMTRPLTDKLKGNDDGKRYWNEGRLG